MRKFIFCLAVLAFAFILPVAIQAQTKGTLTVTVTDPNGAVVPGANVTITNNATGATRTGTSGDNGVSIFAEVEPGTYTVTIENAGFKKSVAPHVVVDVS